MRYTTKARMLSFDFLTDPAIAAMTPTQVMLTVGMIARADNLGRFPGEPSVLLAYLFTPKAPRSDVSSDDVQSTLARLAHARVIEWYWHEGARYAQFRQWKQHQSGLKAHNLKSTLPAPDAAGAKPCLAALPDAPVLALDPPPDTATVAAQQAGVRALIATVVAAGTKAKLDTARIEEWINKRSADSNDWSSAYKFAEWLWGTGIKSNEVVLAILDDMAVRSPSNWYAYYAPGGTARSAIEARVASETNVRQHEAEKAASAAFVGENK